MSIFTFKTWKQVLAQIRLPRLVKFISHTLRCILSILPSPLVHLFYTVSLLSVLGFTLLGVSIYHPIVCYSLLHSIVLQTSGKLFPCAIAKESNIKICVLVAPSCILSSQASTLVSFISTRFSLPEIPPLFNPRKVKTVLLLKCFVLCFPTMM